LSDEKNDAEGEQEFKFYFLLLVWSLGSGVPLPLCIFMTNLRKRYGDDVDQASSSSASPKN
jgi:hypothetical protein